MTSTAKRLNPQNGFPRDLIWTQEIDGFSYRLTVTAAMRYRVAIYSTKNPLGTTLDEGKIVRLPDDREATRLIGNGRIIGELRAAGHCPGCHLGDASPDVHTLDSACEYGGGIF